MIELQTPDTHFHDAHVALDKVRRSKTVELPVETVRTLLVDHANMYRRLKTLGEVA